MKREEVVLQRARDTVHGPGGTVADTVAAGGSYGAFLLGRDASARVHAVWGGELPTALWQPAPFSLRRLRVVGEDSFTVGNQRVSVDLSGRSLLRRRERAVHLVLGKARWTVLLKDVGTGVVERADGDAVLRHARRAVLEIDAGAPPWEVALAVLALRAFRDRVGVL